jgi:hypothetical protein
MDMNNGSNMRFAEQGYSAALPPIAAITTGNDSITRYVYILCGFIQPGLCERYNIWIENIKTYGKLS